MGEVWGPLEDAPRPPTEARAQCTVIAVCETRTVCMTVCGGAPESRDSDRTLWSMHICGGRGILLCTVVGEIPRKP